jgi:hypothetical protein
MSENKASRNAGTPSPYSPPLQASSEVQPAETKGDLKRDVPGEDSARCCFLARSDLVHKVTVAIPSEFKDLTPIPRNLGKKRETLYRSETGLVTSKKRRRPNADEC